MSMNRRILLQSSLAATGGLIATGFAPSAFSAQGVSLPPATEGPLTLYAEFRVPALETQVAALLKVAQQNYQPTDASNGVGLPGSSDNRHYRKALSTEILRNVNADCELRAYLLHGIWESVWDHKDSHLDPRYQAAVAPVAAAVAVGPVKPFYVTRVLVNPA